MRMTEYSILFWIRKAHIKSIHLVLIYVLYYHPRNPFFLFQNSTPWYEEARWQIC